MISFFKRNKIVIAIIAGALILGAAVYLAPFQRIPADESGKCPAPSEAAVTKVIDGDTVVVEGGFHVRLLGIDADESGFPCYSEAKERLEELVLNKKVGLEKDKTDVDQYDRCLRYVFLDNRNVNLQLVKEGLAIARFYPPDVKYKEEITKAEKEAIENEIGCKWSSLVEVLEDKDFQWENLTAEKLGYDVVGACLAGKYSGRESIVEGKVADSYHDLKSNTVFLNFEKAYPNHCFVAVIFSSDLYKFVENPENYYLNKTVRVMGEIKEYKGKPEIILETPNQIEIGE